MGNTVNRIWVQWMVICFSTFEVVDGDPASLFTFIGLLISFLSDRFV